VVVALQLEACGADMARPPNRRQVSGSVFTIDTTEYCG